MSDIDSVIVLGAAYDNVDDAGADDEADAVFGAHTTLWWLTRPDVKETFREHRASPPRSADQRVAK